MNMNIPILRPYQEEAIAMLKAGIGQGHKKLICCVPTGGGKTTIASEIIRGALAKGKKTIFLAHRRELVEQAKGRLQNFGINPGVIMAGIRWRALPVMVGSIQTLQRRHFPEADIVIVDECHHSNSATFLKLIEHYTGAGAVVIGLTATPEREDGKELGDIYSLMVNSVSVQELVGQGFLVPTRVFGAKVNLDDIVLKGRDYDEKSMYQHYDKAPLYDKVVENYNRFAAGTKAIVFNVNVEHSKKTTEAFRLAGISAQHIDGGMPIVERVRILSNFKRGGFEVLCNVNILTEGYDLPGIETVILNRATKSRSLYMQMVGRGLRPAEGKEHCTVIDQGNNTLTFGKVEWYVPPGLDKEENKKKKKKKEKEASPVKECGGCSLLVPLATRVCPECGTAFTKAEAELEEADFSELGDGYLAEAVSKGMGIPAELLMKRFEEMSVEELVVFQQGKGYKLGWLVRQVAKQALKAMNPEAAMKERLQKVASLRNYKSGWVARNMEVLNELMVY